MATQYATWADVAQLGVSAAVIGAFVSLTPVVATGTTPPSITLTGAPVGPLTIIVQAQVGGALTVWSGRYSVDNGVTWTSFTSAAVVEMFDNTGADTGVALNIAAGSAAINNQWTSATLSTRLDGMLQAQSSIADGYIAASGKVLPLLSWGADLRQAIAKLAAYEMMSVLGYNPENPGNQVWRDRFGDAMGWLKDVEAGRASNVNMVEVAPVNTRFDRIEVYTDVKRGW